MSKYTLLKNVIPCILLFFSLSITISAQGTEAMIDQALQEMVSKGELTAADIDEYRMTNHYVSQRNGVDHMYFCQTYNGIDIHNAVGAMHVLSNGNVLTKNIGFSNDFESRMTGSQSPALRVLQAVRQAAKIKGYTISENLQIISQEGGPEQLTTISKGGISLENITAKLKYVDLGKTVRLAWEVSIYEIGAQNWWVLRIDASNGELLGEDNMVDTCFEDLHDHSSHDHSSHNKPLASNNNESKGFNPLKDPLAMFAPDSYVVYAYPNASPHDDGGVARTTEVNPANLTASPFGWHDTDGVAGAEFTRTQGNNAHAYTDTDANNAPDPGSDPDGGGTLDFNFPIDLGMAPSTYRDASVTNLFYWTNIMHDVTYLYGFNEAAGNFQVNNYGNGGAGGDPVLSEAQDGSGNCNANFATPPDGSSGRNQMFTCTNASPARDGALDNEVITHEIGHGVSNRLVGGPANVFCLGNSEQMGEGWSDFMSLIFTIKAGDVGTDNRTVGTWLLGTNENGPGVRPTPYTTNLAVNPTTYGDIGSLAVPHGVGYAWNTMLWEMTWALIDAHGLNPNIYDDWTTGGNNLAMQLVMDGMKLTACSPGFVDGRDAILAADVALTGGANQCIIWEAFAKRGLGFSADQGSSSSTSDGTEAFDLPPSCLLVSDPASQDVCQGTQAVYNLTVGPAMGPITISTSNVPVGAVEIISPNPAPMGGGMVTYTIDNTGAIAPGTYNIDITSDDMMGTQNMTTVELIVTATPPSAQSLISPVDGTSDILQPFLVWDVSNGATSWLLEVDNDPAFGSPEVSETMAVGNYHFNDGMEGVTYYWRVTGMNGCGSETSPVWSFTTAAVSCNFYPSTDVPVIISDGPAAIYTSELTIPTNPSGDCIDINVENINITHTWSGDITLTLISPSGTRVQLLDNDCGSADDIIINFDDEAPFGPLCPTTTNGFYTPEEPISSVYGEDLSGVWTLEVNDVASQDGGSLNSWGLNICTSDTQLCYTDADNDGYGDPATEVETCEPCALGQVTNNQDCDDNDPDIFPGQNCEIAPIPTMGEWGIIILSFLLMIIGIAAVRQRKTVLG